MHHIKHNIKIYLADFILQDMMEVTTKKNRTLVYGMVVNRLTEFNRADIQIDPPIKLNTQ